MALADIQGNSCKGTISKVSRKLRWSVETSLNVSRKSPQIHCDLSLIQTLVILGATSIVKFMAAFTRTTPDVTNFGTMNLF